MVWVSKAGYFDPNLEKFLIECTGKGYFLAVGYWLQFFRF